ncbi:reductase [NADH] FabI [Seminavis robusta]|uniref:Reductase [NADH] FabI n=1 Tax=Seminavis robusta TaxID=568900 RepID=A0A9N8H9V5_9STRA|nr:reductase [NADH] FabI [Seminavis robusta]|eukprot:Sro128_g061150.1 reductase [NADH] FabI (350) ;mRNA; f:36893-37942
MVVPSQLVLSATKRSLSSRVQLRTPFYPCCCVFPQAAKRRYLSSSEQESKNSENQEQHNKNDNSKSQPKVALIMGVANHRSIAWACVQEFQQQGYQVLLTYQNDRLRPSIEKLIATTTSKKNHHPIHALPCNVETDLPRLFQEQIPQVLQEISSQHQQQQSLQLDSIVHSVAFAPFDNPDNPKLYLSEASWHDYQMAMHTSAYSLVETAHYAKHVMNSHTSTTAASITALTYLGSTRAVPHYYLMGPAKAALEANMRALALELGHYYIRDDNPHSIRVNAVSAGPVRTLASRGIPHFTELWQHAQETAPLKRNVTVAEVAHAVRFLAEASGITGQVLHVDGGYSSVVPV